MRQNKQGIPLLKWITQNTHLSRRKAFQAIVTGQVKVDGKAVSDTGFTVTPALGRITLKGKAVRKTPPPPVYIILHKPKGVVTSTSDPEGRTTVLDLAKKIRTSVFPVGRLDIMTQGLLLLTNDGSLAHTLMHPRFSVPRTYHVKVKGKVSPKVFAALRAGALKLDGKPIRPVDIEVLKPLKKNTWLKVTIREGRTREVRRMFTRFDIPVLNLIRVRFGPLTFKGLKPGQWRLLTEREIWQLKQIEKTREP